jgi:hypothetical protein
MVKKDYGSATRPEWWPLLVLVPGHGDSKATSKRGLGLVVDLTENECRYELPSTVKKVSYPIPDFSFRAFEGVLYKPCSQPWRPCAVGKES